MGGAGGRASLTFNKDGAPRAPGAVLCLGGLVLPPGAEDWWLLLARANPAFTKPCTGFHIKSRRSEAYESREQGAASQRAKPT